MKSNDLLVRSRDGHPVGDPGDGRPIDCDTALSTGIDFSSDVETVHRGCVDGADLGGLTGDQQHGPERSDAQVNPDVLEAKRSWSPASSKAVPWLIGSLLFAGLVIRVSMSFDAPVSLDLMRSVFSGRAIWEHGLSTAGRPLLEVFPNATVKNGVAWAENPYNYPPVAVGFFTFIAAIGGGRLMAKLLLTLCDAISSALIVRITKRRWLGIAFWISPVTMWWTSNEGQFEGLQSALAFGSIAAMGNPMLCGLLLSLAVQTKITSIVLFPYLFGRMYRRRSARKFVVAGLIGCIPTVVLSFFYPLIPNILKYSAELRWNPYYWNPFDKSRPWSGSPLLGRIVPQLVSWVLIFGFLVLAIRLRSWLAATPVLLYLAAMKFHAQFTGWYFPTLPLVVIPLFHTDLRRSWSKQTRKLGSFLFGLCVFGETMGMSAVAVWCLK